jgi:ABC-type dipeptide/oligopeptide/nickel transport system permease component
MGKLLLRRALGAALVLMFASFITFALLNAATGDAALVVAGNSATQEQLEVVREEMNLHLPIPLRYLNYIAGIVTRADFGTSLVSRRPVVELIGERFMATAVLALAATAVSLLVGILVGAMAAASKNRWADLSIMALMALCMSLPGFWLALLLTQVFSLQLKLLPVVGGGTLAHLVLPAATLSIPTTAVIARMTRSSLLDAASADYVRTAYAKGASKNWVWRGHILRNALVPVITLASLHLGHLVGGAFIVETIFGWPGLGRLIVQAIFDRDYPVIVAAVILVAVIYQALNLATDLLQGALDPRVRSEAL